MRKLIALLLLFFILFLTPVASLAQTTQEKLDNLRRQIEETERKLAETRQRKITLQNEIAYNDSQIRLTKLKIAETEEEIQILSLQIGKLESALSGLSEVFAKRALKTYKTMRVGDNLAFFLVSDNLSALVSRLYYLKRIQQNDRKVLLQMQTTQSSYETQREKRKELQLKLEKQKTVLDNQKAHKQHLLEITKNDEKKFQQLLAQARAEYEAIQAVVAGLVQETKVGKVNQGERIASIIQSPSCNSSGEHLHFIMRKSGEIQNPFDYLKGGIDYINCSGGGTCNSGDPFNPHGNWEWPISPKIRFTQGYGATWAVRNTWVGKIYSFHNGIDIDSESSPEVRAVRSGILYRGSFSGSGGCALRYVRVEHDGGDFDTLYLHVNY